MIMVDYLPRGLLGPKKGRCVLYAHPFLQVKLGQKCVTEGPLYSSSAMNKGQFYIAKVNFLHIWGSKFGKNVHLWGHIRELFQKF